MSERWWKELVLVPMKNEFLFLILVPIFSTVFNLKISLSIYFFPIEDFKMFAQHSRRDGEREGKKSRNLFEIDWDSYEFKFDLAWNIRFDAVWGKSYKCLLDKVPRIFSFFFSSLLLKKFFRPFDFEVKVIFNETKRFFLPCTIIIH